jgi:hypothetical protein
MKNRIKIDLACFRPTGGNSGGQNEKNKHADRKLSPSFIAYHSEQPV